jgi:hypothetical protein
MEKPETHGTQEEEKQNKDITCVRYHYTQRHNMC